MTHPRRARSWSRSWGDTRNPGSILIKKEHVSPLVSSCSGSTGFGLHAALALSPPRRPDVHPRFSGRVPAQCLWESLLNTSTKERRLRAFSSPQEAPFSHRSPLCSESTSHARPPPCGSQWSCPHHLPPLLGPSPWADRRPRAPAPVCPVFPRPAAQVSPPSVTSLGTSLPRPGLGSPCTCRLSLVRCSFAGTQLLEAPMSLLPPSEHSALRLQVTRAQGSVLQDGPPRTSHSSPSPGAVTRASDRPARD